MPAKTTDKKTTRERASRRREKEPVVLGSAENVGSVYIADDVVSMIASLAAYEVEGVVKPAGLKGELKSKVGTKNAIKSEILGNMVKITVPVTIEYGRQIQPVSRMIQSKVKTSVENMTGLTVSDVNVRITGVTTE